MLSGLAWAFFDADGSLLRVIGTNHDVTERWQAEAESRKLSRAVEQSAAPVLITDITGTIEYVNPAACAAYGYARPELLGASTRCFSSGLTPPETYRAMWATILAGGVWHGELENRRRDGSLLHVALSISPVRDYAGRIGNFVVIQDDLTTRVAAERLQDELRLRLGRVERMEVLGAMAGGVAHDFNNILVAILGFSGLGKVVLRAAGGPERVVRYFEEIETAGERARDLILQLLVFSRRGPLQVTTVAVPELIREVLGLVASSFPAAVTLSASLADELPQLEIDRSHLHRVLVNLCLNARDAMDGPGAVVISACQVRIETVVACASCHGEFSGEFFRLSVTDQGHGIAEAIRDRIFEPFFTTRDVGAGSGMGLAVVHGLVHLHGGHVQIAGATDRGTEMAILLPRSMWHVDP
jgi:PAS domain S-box-containing protein